MKTAMKFLMVPIIGIALMSTALMAGDWTPIYKGVEYQTATKTSPRRMVAYALRIDLHNPAVSFYATPSNGGSPYETNMQTTPTFRSTYGLEAAINANFFVSHSPYAEIEGLLISNGTTVSLDQAYRQAQLRITADKIASITGSGGNPSGIHTAVAGDAYHLVNGTPLGANDTTAPRTSVGLSQDGRYLILCVVDGRQPGYSDGATILDMSYWMLDFGAYNAMNLDGGGSSTICTASGGVLNSPSDGSPRSVGSNLGVNTAARYHNTVCDFNANWTTDRAIFRPSDGSWRVDDITSILYGTAGDICLDGDFNADGRNDFVIWRPSDCRWRVLINGGSTLPQVTYGTAGDIPVRFDYNGDNKEDYALWRPSNGTWYCQLNGGGSTASVQYGQDGDIPVPGDYNGDNKTDQAVFRPSNGTWYVHYNGGSNAPSVQWGTNGDIPVPGDYDGNGTTDYAVWRPSDGIWRVQFTGGDYGTQSFEWGTNGDIPAPGDYNADGRTDFAVVRPSDYGWRINGQGTFFYGTTGDKVLPLPYCIQKFFFPW